MVGSPAPAISRNGCFCCGSVGLFRVLSWGLAVHLPGFMAYERVVSCMDNGALDGGPIQVANACYGFDFVHLERDLMQMLLNVSLTNYLPPGFDSCPPDLNFAHPLPGPQYCHRSVLHYLATC